VIDKEAAWAPFKVYSGLRIPTMTEPFEFYDQSQLLYRLGPALKSQQQEVVFLLGSPLAAPHRSGEAGVSTVSQIIDSIRQEFVNDGEQSQKFDSAVLASGERAYQAAFRFLIGCKGQNVANLIVQEAVLRARTGSDATNRADDKPLSDNECLALEADNQNWSIPPGLLSLGELVSRVPSIFGRTLLTTNFDPLIQQSITRAGGDSYRTTLHLDGNPGQTLAKGCHVVHLHGYWWGSDTLHTARQLTQERPRLKASLSALLRNKLLVVCGYGGWDDVFTKTLFELVQDDSAAPEILWTFRGNKPPINKSLSEGLRAGLNRARVSLYEGIDCNSFFPLLDAYWKKNVSLISSPINSRSNPVIVSPDLRNEIENRIKRDRLIEGDEEDRPPQFDVCIGREAELDRLRNSTARVIFITGIGGQGKSTLAAKYFSQAQLASKYKLFTWRDCKEEGERFENQLAAVIERLSNGEISGIDLARQSIGSLVDILMTFISQEPTLFVFDNVDHYVNRDIQQLNGGADYFVRRLLTSEHKCQALFTCRPVVTYPYEASLSLPLRGLSYPTAVELFAQRKATSTEKEIAEVHSFTDGHAFWLDLLAIQVAKRSTEKTLRELTAQLPEDILRSIWETLPKREQLVLRVLAETVKPTPALEVGDYLVGYVTYNQASKALRSLISQNLVVVKELEHQQNFVELHPLVRQFVRSSFPPVERKSFIAAIISVYRRFMGAHVKELGQRPSFSVLQNWTQKAELDISAGNFPDASTTLSVVAPSFSASAFSREFSRVTRLLLDSVDWVEEHSNLPNFDSIIKIHVENLNYLGEFQEADEVLDKYELVTADRESRYILYCHLKSFSKWIRGEFKDAVHWGKVGVKITDQKKISAAGDIEIRHTLALAQRDAGEPEIALETFIKDRLLEEVTDPDELNVPSGGPFYGNIGGCLQFMGQNENALTCYQKSALLLEKDRKGEHIVNQGYIRRWIGELLIARNQQRLGSIFLEAAYRKWEKASPARAKELQILRERLRSVLIKVDESPEGLELVCKNWILGDYLDDKAVELEGAASIVT
jgi:hypothetical protein